MPADHLVRHVRAYASTPLEATPMAQQSPPQPGPTTTTATTARANTARPPRLARPAPVELTGSPRVRALEAELAEGVRAEEAVARLWRDVAREGTPLIEADPAGNPDHAAVTFLWRGDEETGEVTVLPNKVADPAAMERNTMRRVPGTDVWHWSVRMRRDWRATYEIRVDGVPRRDAHNPAAFPRRWGGEPLSVVRLPHAPSPRAWERRADVARGHVGVHRVRSGALGNEREVWVYEPPEGPTQGGDQGEPEGAPRELPVVVLFDGEMWEPRLDFSALLDNLIAEGRIPPVLALLPHALGQDQRADELAGNDTFLEFLEGELLPWAAGRWPVTADPARTVLAGQSLGGLMSVYGVLRAPHRFGAALAQSGSFWWPNGADAEETERVTRMVAEAPSPVPPVRLRLSAGEQEWVLLPANRRLRDTLAEKGWHATYHEFNGGHDYLCWRDEMAAGLVELLDGA
ncbi:alpha/beta hydrolase-fold protein [Streptomyces sp. NPDC054796]